THCGASTTPTTVTREPRVAALSRRLRRPRHAARPCHPGSTLALAPRRARGEVKRPRIRRTRGRRAVRFATILLLALHRVAAAHEEAVAREVVGLAALTGRRVRHVDDDRGLERDVGRVRDRRVGAVLAADLELREARRLAAEAERHLVDAVD